MHKHAQTDLDINVEKPAFCNLEVDANLGARLDVVKKALLSMRINLNRKPECALHTAAKQRNSNNSQRHCSPHSFFSFVLFDVELSCEGRKRKVCRQNCEKGKCVDTIANYHRLPCGFRTGKVKTEFGTCRTFVCFVV